MRSFILPLAALVASVAAVPVEPAECVTKGNTVVEIYDYTVTSTVYVTEGAIPTSRIKHTHQPKPTTPAYVAPAPTYAPEPEPQPTVVYVPPQYSAPEPEPEPQQPSAPAGHDQTCLDEHNKYRAAHGAAPLSWSSELASYAASHTTDCVMHHSGGPYGENLAFGYGSVKEAIAAWYGEGSQYNSNNPTFQMSTGHYTQVVWKGSKHLGCYTRDCNGRPYTMCEYDPAGNVMGQFQDNV
jgi:uncharacterized protein YkwD